MRAYCPCTDIDYECDLGYIRTDLGQCQAIPDYEKRLGSMIKEDQTAQCESFGYYTTTQGYRKVPGNRCTGGLDLSPVSYSCSGVVGGLVSLKGFLVLAIVCMVLYFGWPIIEAIIILLPIPDPKDVADKVKSLFNGATTASKTALGHRSSAAKKGGVGYTGNFNQAPETLGESDEENDDDIGKIPTLT